jgi:uncharacterized protein (DUF488 family)
MSRRGTLHTLGYAHPDAAKQLERLMEQPHIILVDIRSTPRSRWFPAWNRNALAAKYGVRYVWEQRLGNVNHKHRAAGIKLAEGHREAVIEAAQRLAQGCSLILLCACKRARGCHRSRVARRIRRALRTLQAMKEVQA